MGTSSTQERFDSKSRIVATGADPSWCLNSVSIAVGEVTAINPGDELAARMPGKLLGARGYVCVAGGIDVPMVRGSRSLGLLAGLGGGYGRPLIQGDQLGFGKPLPQPSAVEVPRLVRFQDPSKKPFRVLRGPQADCFDPATWSIFTTETFTVNAQSNRMGARLTGPSIAPQGSADVISEGLVTGAIQITGRCEPIVMLPGRATIGGYVKIATVIEADHDRLGQLPPGAKIRFQEVSLDEAMTAFWEMQPAVSGGLHQPFQDQEMNDDSLKRIESHLDADHAWTPDGVIRVIRELAKNEVHAFAMKVESAGIELAINRSGGSLAWPTFPTSSAGPSVEDPTEHPDDLNKVQSDDRWTITAPLLGTFYRRRSPGESPLIEVGDKVESGQAVGLIEVMKSFYEVTALTAGRVMRVLVEDGATVEYGQALIELEPHSI